MHRAIERFAMRLDDCAATGNTRKLERIEIRLHGLSTYMRRTGFHSRTASAVHSLSLAAMARLTAVRARLMGEIQRAEVNEEYSERHMKDASDTYYLVRHYHKYTR